MNNVRSPLRQHALLWMGLGVFILTVLFVNPVRETPMEDDFAYAWSVQHLLETGKYQLHDWAGANMPFQVYYGALVSYIGGYSFSSLRISTLILAFVGLIAFYDLAREHGLDGIQAGLLMLGLFASPLVLRFSFNFMTDVPFLACLIIALLFYTRAIRSSSYRLMLLASIAAFAAILTRQFGMALIPGVFFLWVLSKERRRQALFFLTGLILPSMAGIWQLSAGTLTPNWTAKWHTPMQLQYFADPGLVLTNMHWRPTVILHYLALFTLPFVFLALLALAFELKQGRFHILESESAKLHVILLGVLAAYILAGMLYGHFANGLSLLMPYLPWNFNEIQDSGRLGRAILTLATAMGAILLALIFVQRYYGRPGWGSVPPSERLLDLVTLFLLLLQLLYLQFGDEYLLVFLPFVLIVVGRHLGNWLNRLRIATGIACLVILVISAMWTRGLLEKNEAYWQGGEFVRSTGVPPNQIFVDWTWASYYRFSDFVAEVGDHPPNDPRDDFFSRWVPEQQQQAPFWVIEELAPPPEERWEVLKEIPYKDIFFREGLVHIVRRRVSEPQYSFIQNLHNAVIDTPKENDVPAAPITFTINNDSRAVLYQPTPSKITYKLTVPDNASLSFGIALNPEAWDSAEGNGVIFEIRATDGQEERELFSKYIDPKNKMEDRKWHDALLDLSKYGDKEIELSFITKLGVGDDADIHWAGWSSPDIVTSNH